MLNKGQTHWQDYLIEAWGLGMLMVVAGVMTVIVEDPGSLLHQVDPWQRRALVGLCVGGTLSALIYSKWGKRSGAHFNPAFTLAFYRLGKLHPRDAAFYCLSHFCGGLAGILLVALLLGDRFTEPPIRYISTLPGTAGSLVAFGVELGMAFGLMTVVVWVSNSQRFHPWTGLLAGILLATYITLLVPFSGTSLNPARTFASALPAQAWSGWWIYLMAPTLGMLLASELYLRITRKPAITLCGKLCPNGETPCPCIVCCKNGCGSAIPSNSGSSQSLLQPVPPK